VAQAQPFAGAQTGFGVEAECRTQTFEAAPQIHVAQAAAHDTALDSLGVETEQVEAVVPNAHGAVWMGQRARDSA
jgi:hypothetical protein